MGFHEQNEVLLNKLIFVLNKNMMKKPRWLTQCFFYEEAPKLIHTYIWYVNKPRAGSIWSILTWALTSYQPTFFIHDTYCTAVSYLKVYSKRSPSSSYNLLIYPPFDIKLELVLKDIVERIASRVFFFICNWMRRDTLFQELMKNLGLSTAISLLPFWPKALYL